LHLVIVLNGVNSKFVFFLVIGGSRKISGIHYTDDLEIPNRSRQLVWRAAVERSNNASQLALQV
jgi:hypothetical protein